jgi:hypothetical protein
MNPFISFCLYVAARVFVQYLKSRPEDNQTGDSLRFLLSAMNAMKSKNPLTESFLVQLDVDLESLGLRVPKFRTLAQNLSGNASQLAGFTRNADGTITDQCAAILKIVDDSDYAENEGQQGEGNTENVNRDREGNSAIDPALKDATASYEPLSWMNGDTGLPVRSTVHPVAMLGVLNSISSSSSYEVFPRRDGFVQSESSNTADMDLSDRPTPNSSTASDTRSNLQGNNKGQSDRSSHASFEASPVSSHDSHNRSAAAFFNHTPDFTSGVSGTGLTPNSNFSMPATPASRNDFAVPNGWELSNQGLTPVGEGVFRELMGMGPMDMGWDGTT